MPKATPKAPASKGKSQLISSFFQKKVCFYNVDLIHS
jgi:hypothetical protein